ncbi:hypothetical protein Tco_1141550, partial [Tanacetum coccineum]
EGLKADNTNLASRLPQSCLRLTLEGFPSSLWILKGITQMFWQDLKDNA